jgi:isoleucyl-tRNA synthetase
VTTDYKDTLRLPKTDFPMKANLAQREKEFLAFWAERDIYGKMQDKPNGAPTFVLHDGPPYANGHIHIGTAFNKILKDFIPKYKSMRGYRAPYVPGWDTHGLPIELKVLKEEGVDKDQLSPVDLRAKCAKYALGFVDVQREEFKRLGVLGDWDNPYLTLRPEYEAAQIEAFADMVEKGLVYKGQKPVFWCTDCQTALAAAEIEYEDEASPSIYVAYPMRKLSKSMGQIPMEDLFVVIWTTTPWTLPASMAVAVHPQYQYGVFCASNGSRLIMAVERKEAFEAESGISLGEAIRVFSGAELEGAIAEHPFYADRDIPLVLADYVVLDSGTGCVHTAPGHGVEDFETGVRYGLEILNPVDNKGVFVKDTPLVGGMSISDGAKLVMSTLAESGRLLFSGKIKHSYPHCWRCKRPVIFRSTDQWFVSVQAFREEAMGAIESVKWVPAWGRDRIGNMVRDRSDWCISRQRVWGVPIPAFYCEDCKKVVVEPPMVRRVAEVIRREGSDAWWTKSPEEMLGGLCRCPHCGSNRLRKESDIMDVWFDSGVSHLAVLETRQELRWPADMYLEGSDQHRGWFQTSLLTGVATRGKAPFRQVLTHGFIVDGHGRKMSKSLGNVTSPQEVIDKYGADILRLWVASTDYRGDVRISDRILKNLVESYRRIRNTARFILGNLSDFDPSKHMVSRHDLMPFDKWALSRLQDLVEKVTKGYEEYEFHVPYFAVYQFCDNDMSSLYLDVCKDRLYADHCDGLSRRSAQSAMWEILISLTKVLAPILSFTCEEIWQFARQMDPSLEESVFLSAWPSVDRTGLSDVEMKNWSRLFEVRGAVLRALEQARLNGMIGNSLEAQVEMDLAGYADLLNYFSLEFLEDLFMVSGLVVSGAMSSDAHVDEETGVRLAVSHSPYQKCPRCWKWKQEVGDLGVCGRCGEVLSKLG